MAEAFLWGGLGAAALLAGALAAYQLDPSRQVIAVIMAVYLTISLSISVFMNWYNKRIALRER